MVSRLLALAACSGCLALVGCDESTNTPVGTPAAATAPTSTSMNATAPNPAVRERISLGAIPFTVEVPQGWLVQPGLTNRIVLHGRAPSGEVDILLGSGPTIKAEALPMMVKQSAKPSSDRYVKNEVISRDNMTLVKRIGPQLAPGAPASPDPELVPMEWTLQIIVSDGKLDYSSYEMTFVGLSQAMFDKDEAFLQKIMDSIRYDAAAARPAMP